jgi:hypothetical protein
MRAIPFALLASVLLACSSSGGSAGGDGGTGGSSSSSGAGSSSGGGSGSSSGGGSTSSGAFSLTVDSATEPGDIGTLAPTSGNVWVVVDLTLANTGSSTPLSVDPVLFSLQTSQSLVVTASPVNVASECSTTVSVASGGHLECKVAFQVPDSQTPTDLLYDDLRGDKATASLPPIDTSAAACTTVSGWLYGSSKAGTTCVDCLAGSMGVFDGGSGPCKSLAQSYQSQCGTACGNKCSLSGVAVIPDSSTCACEQACDTSACQQLFDQTLACEKTTCSSSCP